MIIRPATPDDARSIAEQGEVFEAVSGYGIGYSVDDCEASILAFLERPEFLCFVAVEGSVLGFISGFISPVYFNHSHLSGEEMFWWVSPRAPVACGIRLLAALEEEARNRGCKTWQMKSLAALNGQRMARLYERRGYRQTEFMFLKEL